MAEEDEVDVLGDFSLNTILSKNDSNIFDNTPLVSQNSDLLNCDYTIHPQWLLDRPSTNPALWYNSSPDLDINIEFEPGEPHISTENSINDESGWTEKEKNLLNRGIEIFGKSNVNLSQFIGSRTPAEVKYFLKNFYSDLQLSCSSENIILDGNCVEETILNSDYGGSVSEVLEDNEIPASIEEVIAAVSTAKPTISNNRKVIKNAQINYSEIPVGQSLLKSNYIKSQNKVHFENQKTSVKKISPIPKEKKSVKFKFKTKIKVMNEKIPPANKKKGMVKGRKKTKSETENVKLETTDIQIVTGNGLAVPVSEGEEVIKIQKENETENSDSDIEIDVEDSDNELPPPSIRIKSPSQCANTQSIDTVNTSENREINKNESNLNQTSKDKCIDKNAPRKIPQLSELEGPVVESLMSMEYPQSEITLGVNEITDVEKFIFFEFFEGRPTKTPMRYLRIRNHILNTWKSVKPSYVTKTSIRNGLKQCGDVNCIGRIHNYLEQIGAINFGCEQISYFRPLYDMATITPAPKEKVTPVQHTAPVQSVEPAPRQRNKKKYINDGEGGYTLTHDERGGVINTTVVNEEPAAKQRSYIKKPIVRLIYCRSFSQEKQHFTINLDISALILMDLHAHMYLTEVMGLIGGHWNPYKNNLHIFRYEPCRNIASSSTHCDMCPISQAKAAGSLHTESLDILGWYHSHPTFAPEPSQQDLDTQLSVQQWIGNNKPCVGFILSPFSLHGALIASPYRCMIVDKKENFDDQYVPYKFKVDLVTDKLDIDELLSRASQIIGDDVNSSSKSRVDFHKMYFQDNSISYLDKYIYSVKMHLAKCSKINKMTCDLITDGLTDICSKTFENR